MKKFLSIALSVVIGLGCGVIGAAIYYKSQIKDYQAQLQAAQEENQSLQDQYNELLDNWYGLEGEYNELEQKLLNK